MNRNQALEIARSNYEAHTTARINHLFKRGPAFDEQADFGYRHGWYSVGDFCFNTDEITGIPYDHTQGGWAYL